MTLDDFDGPVISNRDPNSQAAAARATEYAASQRRKVWLLVKNSPHGLACWEVEQITGGLHQSVSATIWWLHRYGWLERIGFNQTPSNRRAYVYRATWGRTP